MPPIIAALIFAFGTIGLFVLDRDRRGQSSPWLWLPVVWLIIGGTRNISVWLGASAFTASPDQYLEGSPLDRAVMSGLIAMGLAVILGRWQRTVRVLSSNTPLLVFFLYCALSTLWSDFPFVAFKRWTKVLGNVVMAFVVLTERDPPAATKKFLTWTGFLLIPQSILCIKYYPELGRYYDRWEGTLYNSGVTTDKNLLGVLCLVLGFGITARFVEAFQETPRSRRRLLAVGTVLGMNVWLLSIANSATSLGCSIIGSVLIVVLGLSRRSRPWLVHLMVLGISLVGATAYIFPDAFAFFVESAGRDATLTGRTELWDDLFRLVTNPWFGTGFESFFLGERIEYLWSKYWWHPNEAHSGYIETYLTLGIVGMTLMAVVLVTGYRNAVRAYRGDRTSGTIRLAVVVISPIYNLTEAAFKVTNPLWILFLLSVTGLPDSVRQKVERRDAKAAANESAAARSIAVRPARLIWGPQIPSPSLLRARHDLRDRTEEIGSKRGAPRHIARAFTNRQM